MTARQLFSLSLTSLTVNLALLALLGYMGSTRPRSVAVSPSSSMSTPALTSPTPSPEPPCPASTPAPFCWGQLESSDYPTYIANLRGIGCPEQTVRDIISADIGGLYAQKREELKARRLNSPELSREIARLYEEQATLLQRLLNPQTSPVNPSSSADPGSIASSAPTPGKPAESPSASTRQPVPYPIVLLSPDSSLNLTPDQKSDWEALGREFVTAVGGLDQDPNNPEYARKWVEAQRTFDERVRTAFGEEIYLRIQTWAAQELASRGK